MEHTQTETVFPPTRLFDWEILRDKMREVAARRPLPPLAAALSTPEVVAPPPPLEVAAVAGVKASVRRFVRAAGRSCLPWRVRHALRALAEMTAPPSGPAPAAPSPPPGPALLPPPAWLLAEWRAIHELEPQLYPEKAVLDRAIRVNDAWWGTSLLGTAYADLCQRLPEKASHIILVPWLKTGGSDRTALNYVKALMEGQRAEGVIVLATEPTDSPWAKLLPQYVAFVEFGQVYAPLSDKQRQLLLVRFLLQKAPRVIHNINSYLTYQVLVKHVQALKQVSNLYTHFFCDDIMPEGQYRGYNRFFLPKCIDALTGVLSDNQTELDRICDVFPFDQRKLITHYQPVEVNPRRPDPVQVGAHDRLEVLWAGRLDRQKRPDLLGKIAERCRDWPFRFHAWGASVVLHEQAALPRADNIVYHGPFDGFASLPTDSCDVYLYTSQWDGLPNILQEAMAVGLPVVAANVGGVRELVIPGETGFLIDPYDNIDAYAEALMDVFCQRVNVTQMVENGYELLRRRHSWKAFTAAIAATPGYVHSTPALFIEAA